MSRSTRDEFGRVAEQATHWLTQPPAAAANRKCLRWLLQSPLHVREAALAIVWDEEIQRCLDPEHCIDVQAFIDRARKT